MSTSGSPALSSTEVLTCPYCGGPAEKVGGAVIYPHRGDLYDRFFWRCVPCKAYVGCHKQTGKPLGRLANQKLREARLKAHEALDRLWKTQIPEEMGAQRSRTYKWLSRTLGIPKEKCHIGMFDEAQCKAVIAAARKKKP